MKKLISVLLIAVLMLSFVTSTAISVFAEESTEAEVSVTEESVNEESVETESVTENKDGKFDMTMQSLTIMGFGMVGIFVVTAIIVCFMYLLCLLKDKKEQ